MTLSEELRWRGFAHQTTYKDETALDGDPITFYWGVDPSADSMTIGNLAAAMMIRKFISRGHKAYLLVGGATGMIGDPDGKKQERDLKTLEQIEANKQAIAQQYSTVFDGQDFQLVDNYSWFKDINYLDFLRDVGKHVPMRQMVGRDFVKSRLSEDGGGLSYAEFSYSLIQGYDFVHLNREHGVTLQLCGADQWGNSIAGVDLARRMSGNEVHVWSSPLVVNKSTGKKFGKSEDGAIWLDPAKTSPYKFYQFWLNLGDEGIEDYLKIYIELDKSTIESLLQEHSEAPHLRLAQRRLANEVTALVHGQQILGIVQDMTGIVFGSGEKELTPQVTELMAQELPVATTQLEGLDLPQALIDLGLADSKRQAREFIGSGAIKIGTSARQISETDTITEVDIEHGIVLVRRGKNKLGVLKIS